MKEKFQSHLKSIWGVIWSVDTWWPWCGLCTLISIATKQVHAHRQQSRAIYSKARIQNFHLCLIIHFVIWWGFSYAGGYSPKAHTSQSIYLCRWREWSFPPLCMVWPICSLMSEITADKKCHLLCLDPFYTGSRLPIFASISEHCYILFQGWNKWNLNEQDGFEFSDFA